MEQREPLYQVWATHIETGTMVPVPMFPRVVKPAAEEFAAKMRQMIMLGHEKRYSDPVVSAHLHTEE